jgi:hypothetical protein
MTETLLKELTTGELANSGIVDHLSQLIRE